MVEFGSVLYPPIVLYVLVFVAVPVAYSPSSRGSFGAGLALGFLTVAYRFGVLPLNAVPELRSVMAFLSPGFGWAVMIVGAVALVTAGVIRQAGPRADGLAV